MRGNQCRKKFLHDKIDHLESKGNEVVYIKGIHKEAEKQHINVIKHLHQNIYLYYDHAIVDKI